MNAGDWSTWADALWGWVLTYAIHSTLLLGGVALLLAWRRRAAPETREVLWRTALFGALLTATVQSTVGQTVWEAPGPVAAAPVAVAPEPAPAPLVPVPLPTAAAAAPAIAPSPAAPPAPEPAARAGAPVAALLLGLWSLGLVGVGIVRGASRRRLAHLLGARRPVDDPQVLASARELSREAGLRRPVRVTECPGLPGPIALGLVRGEVALPPRALTELSLPQQRAMLAHEIAHVKRRDPLWLAAGRLVSALFFFQPLNRIAMRRLHDAAEMQCDAWAAERPDGRRALAECLATVAGWLVGHRVPTEAPAMARGGSLLGARLDALLVERRRRPPPVLVRLGAAALLLALVAAFAPGVSAATAPRRDVPEVRPVVEGAGGGAEASLALLDSEIEILGREITELEALLADHGLSERAARLRDHMANLRGRRDQLVGWMKRYGER